ncbi:MAG: hypothetical protein HY295_03470 [Thaumarchaeota archaeon]|nr:hypothetical protein [Nitrososphaerota archaeon]
MRLFGKKEPSTPTCKVCGMEFTETERMVRHMNKAHSKPVGSKKTV